MKDLIPEDWREVLAAELDAPYFADLTAFVASERQRARIYPAARQVFAALRLTPYRSVRVVLLGQDPYHGAGQAHGLCFSVPPGQPPPPSLRNILRELQDDLGCPAAPTGSLVGWAEQGVLLLNTVLTVREGEAHSHRGHGWERFTDAVIQTLARQEEPIAFLLWGNPARRKRRLIGTGRHPVIEAAHPSPLSAHRGFLGSRPFSRTNAALQAAGQEPVRWCRTGAAAG